MDKKSKKELSETDICDLFITPAIKEAGWDQVSQIRRDVTLTPGPIIVRGNMSSRNKKKKKFADYVLSWEPGVPLAVVEAKSAYDYCELLFNLPKNFSFNLKRKVPNCAGSLISLRQQNSSPYAI